MGRGRAGGGMGATIAGAPLAPGPGNGGSGAPSWPCGVLAGGELSGAAGAASAGSRGATEEEPPPQLIMDLCIPDLRPGPGRRSPRILPSRATSMNTPRRHFLSEGFEVLNLKAVYSSAFPAPALPFVH